MQTATGNVARGQVRPMAVAQPRNAAIHKSGKAKRDTIVPKAAVEEVQTLSTNGAGKVNGSALDFDELTELIKMVHNTDIVELELNSKKFKLSVKKREALESMEPQIIHMAAPQAMQMQQAYAPAPTAPAPGPVAPAVPTPAAAPAPPAPAAVDGVEIASPMAGTFYRTPAPGEAPFVSEGDKVVKGQTIGIIEAMKLMNEIEAEIGGTVVKILADNGKSVTPGQPLLIIKP